jgi:XTP/dITP diphosphohydrolase
VDGVRRAILCSRNPHKARELERLLSGWTIEPLDRDDYPPETGTTYYENAARKAAFGRSAAPGAWILAEDSGIEVAALGGRPGIESARYAPEGAPAIAKLLDELGRIADRRARYVSELVALSPEGDEFRGSGVLQGWIAEAPRGSEGFGYDPVFVPVGEERTVAELGDGWKERNSHRARAARALLAALGAVVAALLLAGCGSKHATGQRQLSAFFAHTKLGQEWGRRFPHRPGSRPCVAFDDHAHKRVPATCSTDVAVQQQGRVLATFSVSWNHGNRVRAWFVFLHEDGTVVSVTREGEVPAAATTTS